MNSEKVKEIKELLRCMNGEKACTNCYINEIAEEQETCCINVVADMTLALINELKSENERLKEENSIIKSNPPIIASRSVGKTIRAKLIDYDKLKTENQQLKDRIAELEKEKTCVWEEWTDGDHSIWCCSNCKEDFSFMEGDVYENNYGYCPHCGAKITALKELKEDDIDKT